MVFYIIVVNFNYLVKKYLLPKETNNIYFILNVLRYWYYQGGSVCHNFLCITIFKHRNDVLTAFTRTVC